MMIFQLDQRKKSDPSPQNDQKVQNDLDLGKQQMLVTGTMTIERARLSTLRRRVQKALRSKGSGEETKGWIAVILTP